MPSIVVDAGPLVAFLDRGDSHHTRAAKFSQSTTADFVTNVAVHTEVAYLLSFSRAAVNEAVEWVSESFDVDRDTAGDLPRIMQIMKKYDDLPADFADASLVALCERRHLISIATFDRDFDIYRTSDGKALKNVLAGSSGAPA